MKWLVGVLFFIGVAHADVDMTKRLSTYSASAVITVGATATDICKISGASGKVIRVHSIQVQGIQTTAGNIQYYIYRRSTDNTGGTLVGMSPVKYDTNTAAAGASTVGYSANPTTGTTLGLIKAFVGSAGSSTGAAQTSENVYEFNDIAFGLPITLRSASETLVVNLGGGATPAGLVVSCGFEWTEE